MSEQAGVSRSGMWRWWVGAALVVVTAGVASWMYWPSLTQDEAGEVVFSADWSLKELAERNGVSPGELRYKLSHDVGSISKQQMKQPIRSLGFSQEAVLGGIEHVHEDKGGPAAVGKYVLWAAAISVVLAVILHRKRIGRVRRWWLVGAVLVFGVVLGVSPNPMESVVKLGKWFGGIQGGPAVVVAAFGLFTLFSVPAAKLVCSWGCQLGALQESIFNIPLLRKKYRWHVPFWVSLGARLVLFGAFVVLLFGLGDFVVFHHVNYFKVFRPAELAPFAAATVGVMLLASFFVYRPFCQFVCPFGLWAWVLESVAPVKVRLDESKCIHCERCVRQCPTEAMKARYADKRGFFLPDCWSCGTCREVCPTDAITFEAARPGARTHTNETAEAGGSENSTSSGRH